PDAALFHAAECQRSTAVRAKLVEDADLALAVPEGHQPLAKQRDTKRITVRPGDLGGDADRKPVTAEHFAHRRARADSANPLVVATWKHGPSSGPVISSMEGHRATPVKRPRGRAPTLSKASSGRVVRRSPPAWSLAEATNSAL